MSEHRRRAEIAAPKGTGNGVGRRAMRASLERTHQIDGRPVTYSHLGGEAMRADRPRVPWVDARREATPEQEAVRKTLYKAAREQERRNQRAVRPTRFTSRQRMTQLVDG
jgi:hypothetical protein